MAILVVYVSSNPLLSLLKRRIDTIGDVAHYFTVAEPFKCTMCIGLLERP